MNVLCIADVCGSGGCNALLKALPKIKIQENLLRRANFEINVVIVTFIT